MAYIEGESRGQHTLFPTILDELIPQDHVCRVIEAFVDRLEMSKLGFVRSEPAETGRPGYDPRDLLKLSRYGYLWQIRPSRRLETECQRNVEVMWLLGRLGDDRKRQITISSQPTGLDATHTKGSARGHDTCSSLTSFLIG